VHFKSGATLKPRNATQKWKSGIWELKPESRTGNWTPEIKENKFFRYAKFVLLSVLPLKKMRPSNKDLKLNLF